MIRLKEGTSYWKHLEEQDNKNGRVSNNIGPADPFTALMIPPINANSPRERMNMRRNYRSRDDTYLRYVKRLYGEMINKPYNNRLFPEFYRCFVAMEVAFNHHFTPHNNVISFLGKYPLIHHYDVGCMT